MFYYLCSSKLIHLLNQPREPTLLIMLDRYQRTKAATQQELINTTIPKDIRSKLNDIYESI